MFRNMEDLFLFLIEVAREMQLIGCQLFASIDAAMVAAGYQASIHAISPDFG